MPSTSDDNDSLECDMASTSDNQDSLESDMPFTAGGGLENENTLSTSNNGIGSGTLSTFDDNICCLIAKYLPLTPLYNISRTCTRFHCECDLEDDWKGICGCTFSEIAQQLHQGEYVFIGTASCTLLDCTCDNMHCGLREEDIEDAEVEEEADTYLRKLEVIIEGEMGHGYGRDEYDHNDWLGEY